HRCSHREELMTRAWPHARSALLITLFFVTTAQAGTHDDHLKAATELLEVMHTERTINDAIDIVVKAQVQGNPQLAQYEDLLRAFLAKYMAWDALRDDYARLYVDTFTETEIKKLLKFYRTPVGQKVIESLPEIMRKGADLGQAKVSAHLDELTSEVT